MSDDILSKSGAQLAKQVGERRIRAVELVSFFLERVEKYNPLVNAVCTLNQHALDQAAACDERILRGERPRLFEGVPFVAKDILHSRDVRTTFGSRIFERHVPDEDSVAIERLKAAGAILIGKTNTPEFAHDINTSNYLFGTTRNPADLNTSAGGSSGGTAAALAAGMAPLGLGTDLGGSIRIPSAFCGVSGIRPAPGRVPVYPAEFGWDTLVEHVHGPMATRVEDLGAMLAAMAGPDDRDPSSIPLQPHDYALAGARGGSLRGRRVAYSPDLNGLVPLDPDVAALAGRAVRVLEDLGCVVEEDCFDVSGLREIRAGTRGFGMVARYAHLLREHADVMTPALTRQIKSGMTVDVQTVTDAERLRTSYWHRVRRFLEKYEYIVTPAVGAPAFRLDQPLPTTIGGRPAAFRDVFLFSYAFSVTGLPVAAVPCGVTPGGLPVGIQIVGRRLREDLVLQAASAYAAATAELRREPGVNMASISWMTPDPLTDFP